MKAPFTLIGSRSFAGIPVRFFTAAEIYRLEGTSQPLVAWHDLLRALGIPVTLRFVMTRRVADDQRYAVTAREGIIKAVTAPIALATIAGVVAVGKRRPELIDEFIRISADATAEWVRAIAVDDFAATDIDQETADYWIERTAEAAREVANEGLKLLICDKEVA